MIRSKANWLDGGEEMSTYFFALEKRNFNKKTITTSTCKDGTIVTERAQLLFEQQKFHTSLYKAREMEISGFPNIEHPTLSQQAKILMDEDITSEELNTAMNQMASNKTSGVDGLSVNFYNRFWDTSAPIYYDAITEGLKSRIYTLQLE